MIRPIQELAAPATAQNQLDPHADGQPVHRTFGQDRHAFGLQGDDFSGQGACRNALKTRHDRQARHATPALGPDQPGLDGADLPGNAASCARAHPGRDRQHFIHSDFPFFAVSRTSKLFLNLLGQTGFIGTEEKPRCLT